jgi:methylated-DNA-[protein]-cysteine S-methyltransferase
MRATRATKAPEPEPRYGAAYTTPLGTLVALASPAGLVSVGFDLDPLLSARQEPNPTLDAFQAWLAAYLGRDFDRLPPVPLDLRGGAFEIEVWKALLDIRPGRYVSYGDLAAKLKRPNSARAVGAAVGKNPLMIIVPCHRVLGSGGKLTGYGGGVDRKAWLLRHEGSLLL